MITPVWRVSCDKCYKEMIVHDGGNEDDAAAVANRRGWQCTDMVDLCPKCRS